MRGLAIGPLLTLGVLLFTCGSADAARPGALSAGDLLTACQAEQQLLGAQSQSQAVEAFTSTLSCVGFVRGFVDGVTMQTLMLDPQHASRANICIPDNATDDKLIDIYVDYEAKRPKHQSDLAMSELHLALWLVYRCKVRR
jgi:Rap1a immunity proteins